MADHEKRITGQPLSFSAREINDYIDAALAEKNRSRNIKRPQRDLSRQRSIFPVLNDSGADFDRFNIVGVTGVVITPTDNLLEFKNRISFIVDFPQFPDNVAKFGILQEPVAEDLFAKAAFAGLSVVEIDMIDENHTAAEITQNENKFLTSNDTGSAKIMFVEPGTGVKFAVVRIGNTTGTVLLEATLDVAMRRNETKSVTITATGDNQDVEDVEKISSTTELNAGNHVTVTQGDPGVLISFDCEDTTDI